MTRLSAIRDAVRSARSVQGWSQRDLAEQSGVPLGTIAALESGRYVPNDTIIERIAWALWVAGADIPLVRGLFQTGVGTQPPAWMEKTAQRSKGLSSMVAENWLHIVSAAVVAWENAGALEDQRRFVQHLTAWTACILLKPEERCRLAHGEGHSLLSRCALLENLLATPSSGQVFRFWMESTLVVEEQCALAVAVGIWVRPLLMLQVRDHLDHRGPIGTLATGSDWIAAWGQEG